VGVKQEEEQKESVGHGGFAPLSRPAWVSG
jgi:hypothetical protein